MHRFLITLLAVTVFCSCGNRFQKDPHTLYLVLSGEPNYLNWVPYSSAFEADVVRELYQPMMHIDYNDNNALRPALATNITISADKRTYTVYMRTDQVWEDGNPVTAKDALFTYQQVLKPESRADNKLDGLKDIVSFQLVSDHQIRITYRKPDVTAVFGVADLRPIPRHIWQGKKMTDPTLNRKPLGNGPFKFKSWNTGRSIVLVRNPRYRGTPQPFFKRVIFRVIPESAARLAALRKGSVDYVERIRPFATWINMQQKADFSKNLVALKYPSSMYSHIAWQGDGSNPFFGDKRVRRAMTLCLNRKQIIEKIAHNLALPISGPFFPTSWANDRSIPPLPYDPEQAAALLDEAGWKQADPGKLRQKNGKQFVFEYLLSSGSELGKQIAVILKNELEKIGIGMKIRILEWSVFNKRLTEREFQACTFSWDNTVDHDVTDLWHSSMQKPGTGLNLVGYSNRQVDQLLEQAKQVFNHKERQRISRRIHRLIHEDQPYTFIYSEYKLDMHDKRLRGVKTSLRGPLDAWPGISGWKAVQER